MNIPKGWKRIVRASGLIEWECPHGVGHPAPVEHQSKHISANWRRCAWDSHGCDGCCARFAPLACMDCGLAYECFPLDVNLSDHQWMLIAGREGGVLCPGCICKRGAKLPGVTFAKLEFR